MADVLNSVDNTLKHFPSNRSHSPNNSSTSSTEREEGNSSDSDISGTTPQVKEDDMSKASVAFNTVPCHDVMTDLMKRTENDPSKAEGEEVKSKPRDTSAGNGSPKEESSKAEEEEVKSELKNMSAGNDSTQDEPAVGAAATEDDEVQSKSKSSSLDSVCHDHDSARVSRTQSAICKLIFT